ncbi:hypothetical protein AN218_22800 [Streptomyces nanshensis]|uniref:Roadblock/LAMTOR2 domain-containing protein n=2 Tax=Streptomyces nanshensis TaxID=518642 RepID=A0A1E7KZJ7_9ACTN|nr:hypothetical protein AN218_22800 [Streptomyces nanshensis]
MNWVMDNLTQEKGVMHAVLLSGDGLKLAHSNTLTCYTDGCRHKSESACPQAGADRLAAKASGINSLARVSEHEFPGAADLKPRKVMVDLDGHTLLVFSGAARSSVVVFLEAEFTSAEVSVATSATIKVINGLREKLSARERTDHPRRS